MKPRFLTLLVVALIAGLTGAGITRAFSSIKNTQHSSFAGQTLADLSRALESEKEKTGRYPDSIAALKIESSGGDFSPEILKEVTYYKTETGFIAFVGGPNVSYIHPGVSTQYK
jgi:type II secretory pathway pseudopilin PulG